MSTETAIWIICVATVIGAAVGVWLYLDRKI